MGIKGYSLLWVLLRIYIIKRRAPFKGRQSQPRARAPGKPSEAAARKNAGMAQKENSTGCSRLRFRGFGMG